MDKKNYRVELVNMFTGETTTQNFDDWGVAFDAYTNAIRGVIRPQFEVEEALITDQLTPNRTAAVCYRKFSEMVQVVVTLRETN